MHILITCPPMIKQIKRYDEYLKSNNFTYFCPKFDQVMEEDQLIELLPNFDAWIIGDDPTNYNILSSSKRLKYCIKWGVGVDNIDFDSFKKLNIHIENTPDMFGNEVADVALGYLLMLSRELHTINNKVRHNIWYKPTGISLTNKKACLIGFGDIGRNVAKRLLSFGINVHVSDPGFNMNDDKIICKYNPNVIVDMNVKLDNLDNCLNNADFIIVTCALNNSTHGLINKENILKSKKGVRIINVSRGAIVCEKDVVELLYDRYIDSVAFDVFEEEPVKYYNRLLNYEKNIFGSHNGSNTIEAVDNTSFNVINKLINIVKIE